MSFNIRDYVSDDHIESIGEIATGQAKIIQALTLDNSQKDREIERLNEELEVAKTNEETYRLEMLDITKRLGLDEETLFDDVKDKAERLNNIINELEKTLNNYDLDYMDLVGEHLLADILEDLKDKIKELKGSE